MYLDQLDHCVILFLQDREMHITRRAQGNINVHPSCYSPDPSLTPSLGGDQWKLGNGFPWP
jgi:hypothetical protein